MNTDKKIVSEYITCVNTSVLLSGKTLDEVVEALKTLQNKYPDRVMYFEYLPGGYHDSGELQLHEYRLETDKEYNQRIKNDSIQLEKEKSIISKLINLKRNNHLLT